MSSYIIERDPNKYGGQQLSYVEQGNTIVAKTAETFHEAVESKRDLKELFHETLASLRDARHRIAVENKTEKADLFGARRDLDPPFSGPFVITSLSDPYDEYNKSLLPVLQEHLSFMKHDLRSFDQTEWKIQLEKCLGRASSMEFTILSSETSKNWAFPLTSEGYKRLCKLCSVTPSEEPYTSSHFNHLIENKEAMLKLREVSIEDYKRLKNSLTILHIRTTYPKERKSDWVLVTMRSEIKGKMYALSQYLTWMYRDYKNDPVTQMTDRSIISIIHQDPFLIEPMLDDCAEIFKEAIEWDGADVKTLKDRVALLVHDFGHDMPLKRGSAAVGEWLERSIYRYHGFDLKYNPKKMVNLEALTSSPKQFIDNYDSIITLEKLEDSQVEKI